MCFVPFWQRVYSCVFVCINVFSCVAFILHTLRLIRVYQCVFVRIRVHKHQRMYLCAFSLHETLWAQWFCDLRIHIHHGFKTAENMTHKNTHLLMYSQ